MKKSFEEVQKKIAQLQRELQELELDFIQNVVEAVGPANAVAFRAAILGDAAIRGGGGAGNILRDLKDRPLSALLANNGQPHPVCLCVPSPEMPPHRKLVTFVKKSRPLYRVHAPV